MYVFFPFSLWFFSISAEQCQMVGHLIFSKLIIGKLPLILWQSMPWTVWEVRLSPTRKSSSEEKCTLGCSDTAKYVKSIQSSYLLWISESAIILISMGSHGSSVILPRQGTDCYFYSCLLGNSSLIDVLHQYLLSTYSVRSLGLEATQCDP